MSVYIKRNVKRTNTIRDDTVVNDTSVMVFIQESETKYSVNIGIDVFTYVVTFARLTFNGLATKVYNW